MDKWKTKPTFPTYPQRQCGSPQAREKENQGIAWPPACSKTTGPIPRAHPSLAPLTWCSLLLLPLLAVLMVPRGAGHRVSILGLPASPLTYGATTPLLLGVLLLLGAWGAAYAPRPGKTHGSRGLTTFIFRRLRRGHKPAVLPRSGAADRPLYSIQREKFW